MRYRLTCLTPLLVGNGNRLSPIDYMVWKDQVNVLDQGRIFKLLSRGPRLDGYLAQIKKADKLDFASWGGFAQNFADRRIPFEHPSYSAYWNRAAGESLQIPTFVSRETGPYLPGAALKGALRTGLFFAQRRDGMLREAASKAQGETLSPRTTQGLEEQALGTPGNDRMRVVGAGDSDPIPHSGMKVYLLRVSTLVSRQQGSYALAWKQSPRGSVQNPADSTPFFAEMAAPGAAFDGVWQEKTFFQQEEIRRALGWRHVMDRKRLFDAANRYAAAVIETQKEYASWTGLSRLSQSLGELEARLANIGGACLLSMGWGGGLPAKTAWPETTKNEDYQKLLQRVPAYSRALGANLPFPKTRRIVFMGDQPAALPGWALLEVE
ncbi:MAG: type III-A CRISPR-associated RAMP protein Csm5 [Bryobacteraceae bacterium]